MRDVCDLALAHRLELADREYSALCIVAATSGGDVPNIRQAVDEWLNAEDVPEGPDAELRAVLGV